MAEVTQVTQAAAKPTKLMLTELERVVFERCKQTGDTAEEALECDDGLHVKIVRFVQDQIRKDRVDARLGQDNSWLKQQIKKLQAGVRPHQDAEIAMQRGIDEANELHGAPDA